jgi:DNA-binding NtrC family response regulator
MDGRQLAARVSAERPSMRTLLMSGYLDRDESQGGPGRAGSSLLEKPFTAKALIQRVRDTLSETAGAVR